MLSIRATVVSPNGSSDVVVELEDDARGADLVAAVQALGWQTTRVSVDGRVVGESALVVEHPLVHGSRIEIATASRPEEPPDGPILVVVSGPEAGAWYPIPAGSPVRVGRSDCEVNLARDHLLSKQHVRFAFDGLRVVVEDLGSSNGTYVEGEAIAGPVSIEQGTYVHVGSSTLAVVALWASDRAVLGQPTNGAYPFPRTFRVAREPLTIEHRLPRKPAADNDQGSTWWRSLLPLATGVGFAVITGNYLFLLISALAPLVYAIDALRQRRRRVQARTQEAGLYTTESAAVREAFTQSALEERRRKRYEHPVGGTANVYGMVRHRRLWERRPGDDDFLCVPFGLATRPSTAYLHDPGIEASARERMDLWGTPVLVDLAKTGSIAVLGETARSRAVVRSLLMGLASTHSPSEVKIWIFAANDSEEEWAPLRWLPHLAQDGSVCRIASTPADRSALMSSLRQIIDARAESRPTSSTSAVQLPVHVVVIDGSSLVPSSDLSATLVEGRSIGVLGIVADPNVGPDGIMGTLRLGNAADEATFVSHVEPLITGVLTAEMPAAWVETGARRLAALQPAATGRAELGSTSERLARMVNYSDTTAHLLVDRWRSRGPTTRVPVGTMADASFSVDVVADGPHGLVGGMTRSGKTEFLKTLITSLAWMNHPDDLNFVIVDFKGGVDYTVAGRLPHVLDLSSNQDLAGFERTLRLLSAEQRRRQVLFERLQVANLDAYRLARSQRPDLPPVPRMIVLIDEFGELLASDEGREQLRRIESMSRIGGGLGVNLLLITQNFEGQLPPQIAANAGLRVCFRVQDPANSRVVIDSGIAATIPASAKGRAYARLQGGEPVEFQSARVAGRRPELRDNSRLATVRLQPYEALPRHVRSGDVLDVPAEETDMHAMIDLIIDAAHLSGWTTPAVPWPKVLPVDIALADVVASMDEAVSIGRADLPEQQRQATFAIRRSDEHVALLGGPRADLNTALVSIACSAAATHSPDDLHIYGIDFTGRGLARIAQLPHCGGLASRNDMLAVRIARHLLDEVTLRRSELSMEGVSTLSEYEARTGRTFPHVLLMIAGAEKLSSIANTDGQSAASPALTSLVAEGAGLGVQVVAAGLPAFGVHRPGNYIDRRIVFETSDPADYLPLGCPRQLLGEVRGSRRGVDLTTQVVVQLASLSGGAANEADVLDALVARLKALWPPAALRRPPKKLLDITWPTDVSALSDAVSRPPQRLRRPFPVGVDNATGEAVWVDADECGGSFFVAGGRKTGRSSALISIGLLARHSGWDVVAVAASPQSPLNEPGAPFVVTTLDQIDDWFAAPGAERTMVLLDDINRWDGDDEAPLVVGLEQADVVIASGPSSTFAGMQRCLTNRGARRATSGIVLMPEGHTDAELLGARGDAARIGTGTQRRAGQGLLGVSGEITDITIPLTSHAP